MRIDIEHMLKDLDRDHIVHMDEESALGMVHDMMANAATYMRGQPVTWDDADVKYAKLMQKEINDNALLQQIQICTNQICKAIEGLK